MTMTRTTTTTAATTPEQDVRLNLLNTLLTTPHRELAKVWPVHREMAAADPRFYVRLGAWYHDRGDVRDHKEMFVVTLSLSDFPGHRDVGLALLRQMPPYQVARVLDFIHGRKTTRKVPIGERPKGKKNAKAKKPEAATTPVVTAPPGFVGRMVNAGLGRDTPAPAQATEPAPQQAAPTVQYREVTEAFGLFRTPPRSLRREIECYLRERELYVYAFDTIAYPIERGAGGDLASWERAMNGIRATGGTSAGAAVEALRLRKQYVEQLLLVTDEEENTAPTFTDALARYRDAVKADPNVCIVRLGHTSLLETRCRQAGVSVDVFQFAGDDYALPNLVPLLSKPSKLELLTEIMDYPLPARKSA